MTFEAQRVSGPSENGFGSLSSCLVEGDPQSEKRARRIKQRAVAFSIILQGLALVALVLFPLLTKGERISLKDATPIPPYAPIGNPRHAPPDPGRHIPAQCQICVRLLPPTPISVGDPNRPPESDGLDSDPMIGLPSSPGTPGGRIPTNPRPVLPPPGDPPQTVARRPVSELAQMAQLIHRVEPIYPPLAKQIQHEGRVELRAIISTAGTIESLEVISGDPLLIPSALAAVREWRYRPTILNGRPIEVDTRITVIYTLSH